MSMGVYTSQNIQALSKRPSHIDGGKAGGGDALRMPLIQLQEWDMKGISDSAM